jgi:hypothetical protein
MGQRVEKAGAAKVCSASLVEGGWHAVKYLVIVVSALEKKIKKQ